MSVVLLDSHCEAENGGRSSLSSHIRHSEHRAAAEAIRLLLQFIGENPDREGLVDTPDRVIKAFKEYFSGYQVDPIAILRRTFSEIEGYSDSITLKGIPFISHCEHHIAPIVGFVDVAYVPTNRVVGISKLARVVEAYAKRLQIQERMTAQIANAVHTALQPQGVAVVVEAEHFCMTARGVGKPGTRMRTSKFLGRYQDDGDLRQEFLRSLKI